MRKDAIKKRCPSGSNSKEQHNGVNTISINRNNVMFTNRCTNDQRTGERSSLVLCWETKATEPSPSSFRNPCLLLSRISSQRPIDTLLQPCEHPHHVPCKQLMAVSSGGHGLVINQDM
ncbi:hypothetical protein Rs2_27628 [Raphanus sativus]|nr:hypothetical protein Rs2_27628 [Raphanus sativus]